ncbi:Photosystem I assembly protein Ycf3 [Porphyromonas levii]|uniref:tetratricopeptide repeat protein n=1 Tax=Porphyromonas levii TaxID=28114 RepID=UPI001B8C3A98|nr:tetratricopeptide repeat protein [Porphyromonas levii]MBR8731294.1 Photosystem I assembly protein Ycf3 [Porphyromonas levii]MBR8758896.1 Photosystem I assembly protein Ycf3 [Porphyromonas levii]MBR8763990.1 Photosystem I assembly protein Ycf3 [Porphyromonas levii]MBR8769273.1 Photosystem I assembly protein Ycf3 [Porphyromonas levii]MBR8784229.1 Photosystem I assembly protein Ycf3 [Porphyromonas levii]
MARLSRSILLTFLLFGLFATKGTAQIDTDRAITVGRNALYFKDYVLAIQYFNSAIQADPHLADPYYLRGLAKYSLDDYLGAEADSDAALERNPFIYGAHYLRAISRHTLGKDSLALQDYEVVLRDNPDHKGALHNSAILRIALKDNEGARKVLDHLERYFPDYAHAYVIDGGLRLEQGDTVAALKLFEKALEVSPSLPNAYLSMAGIAYDRQKYTDAEVYIDRALEYMPDLAELYINRAIIRFQQYNIKGAMTDYSTAIDLSPENTLALYNRALLRSQVGETNGALEDFNRVATLEPGNYFALFNRAILSNQVGEYRQAEADLDRIIERYPTFLPALVERADARNGLGKTMAAKQDLYAASKMTYDQKALNAATAKQNTQDALEAETKDRVRDDKDENIQKFRSLVYASNDNTYDELYSEDQGIRGRIQDLEVVVEPEPLFSLSYYVAVDKQLKGNTNVAYSAQLQLPAEEYNVLVVQRVPQLTSQQLQVHLDSISNFDITSNQSADAMIRYALDQLTLKDHQSVIDVMTLVIDAVPDDPAPYFQRAVSRVLAYEADQATHGRGSQPSIIFSESTISTEYVQKKATMQEASKDLLKVLELVPNYVPALFNLGYIHAALGSYDDAIKYYSQAIQAEPNLGSAYYNRGLCYYATGEKEKGDRDLSQAGALGLYKAYSIIKRMK